MRARESALEHCREAHRDAIHCSANCSRSTIMPEHRPVSLARCHGARQRPQPAMSEELAWLPAPGGIHSSLHAPAYNCLFAAATAFVRGHSGIVSALVAWQHKLAADDKSSMGMPTLGRSAAASWWLRISSIGDVRGYSGETSTWACLHISPWPSAPPAHPSA